MDCLDSKHIDFVDSKDMDFLDSQPMDFAEAVKLFQTAVEWMDWAAQFVYERKGVWDGDAILDILLENLGSLSRDQGALLSTKINCRPALEEALTREWGESVVCGCSSFARSTRAKLKLKPLEGSALWNVQLMVHLDNVGGVWNGDGLGSVSEEEDIVFCPLMLEVCRFRGAEKIQAVHGELVVAGMTEYACKLRQCLGLSEPSADVLVAVHYRTWECITNPTAVVSEESLQAWIEHKSSRSKLEDAFFTSLERVSAIRSIFLTNPTACTPIPAANSDPKVVSWSAQKANKKGRKRPSRPKTKCVLANHPSPAPRTSSTLGVKEGVREDDAEQQQPDTDKGPESDKEDTECSETDESLQAGSHSNKSAEADAVYLTATNITRLSGPVATSAGGRDPTFAAEVAPEGIAPPGFARPVEKDCAAPPEENYFLREWPSLGERSKLTPSQDASRAENITPLREIPEGVVPYEMVNDEEELEQAQERLAVLIALSPEPLNVCDIPGLFKKHYGVSLNYRKLGFTTLELMCSSCPGVKTVGSASSLLHGRAPGQRQVWVEDKSILRNYARKQEEQIKRTEAENQAKNNIPFEAPELDDTFDFPPGFRCHPGHPAHLIPAGRDGATPAVATVSAEDSEISGDGLPGLTESDQLSRNHPSSDQLSQTASAQASVVPSSQRPRNLRAAFLERLDKKHLQEDGRAIICCERCQDLAFPQSYMCLCGHIYCKHCLEVSAPCCPASKPSSISPRLSSSFYDSFGKKPPFVTSQGLLAFQIIPSSAFTRNLWFLQQSILFRCPAPKCTSVHCLRNLFDHWLHCSDNECGAFFRKGIKVDVAAPSPRPRLHQRGLQVMQSTISSLRQVAEKWLESQVNGSAESTRCGSLSLAGTSDETTTYGASIANDFSEAPSQGKPGGKTLDAPKDQSVIAEGIAQRGFSAKDFLADCKEEGEVPAHVMKWVESFSQWGLTVQPGERVKILKRVEGEPFLFGENSSGEVGCFPASILDRDCLRKLRKG